MKEYTITDIEAMNEQEAQKMAESTMQIKEHNIYFVDFGGYFKFSALVFMNGKHIYYANDYELHHAGRTHEELKAWYIETLNHKLYTEKELAEPVKDYDDYQAKDYFLRNYYPMRYDYISAFNIFHNDEEEEAFRKQIEGMFLSRISFAYYKNVEIVEKLQKMTATLEENRKKSADNYDYMKAAIIKELWNHEYMINWQADYDLFSAFGCVTYGEDKTAADYMEELKFTETQKKAFYDGRNEYYKAAESAY